MFKYSQKTEEIMEDCKKDDPPKMRRNRIQVVNDDGEADYPITFSETFTFQ